MPTLVEVVTGLDNDSSGHTSSFFRVDTTKLFIRVKLHKRQTSATSMPKLVSSKKLSQALHLENFSSLYSELNFTTGSSGIVAGTSLS